MDEGAGGADRNAPTRVRAAVLSDAAEISRLSTVLGYPATTREMASRLSEVLEMDNHLVAVAAGPDGTLLGWVAVEHRFVLQTGGMVEIVGLVVDDAVRRTGIGAALVAEAERWAADKGQPRIFVRSNAARETAHDFYRRLGYLRRKTQHAYVKEL